MKPLTNKEKCVLDLRYGLSDGQPRRLAEIARMLRMSRQHIWEVERTAMWKVSLDTPIMQTGSQSPKVVPSALLKLRATLSDSERQILSQKWGIAALNAASISTPHDQIRQVEVKALSMV